jgi:hypothetical protein
MREKDKKFACYHFLEHVFLIVNADDESEWESKREGGEGKAREICSINVK